MITLVRYSAPSRATVQLDVGTLSSWLPSFFPASHQPYPNLFPQVLGFALIILCTSSVSVTLWRIQQGTPQALEFLIHPTVWLTTMVNDIPRPAGLSLATAFRALVEGMGQSGAPSLPSLPPPFPASVHLPPDSLVQSFAVFLIHAERKKGVQASGVLFGYWLLCFLFPATSTAQQASQGVSGGLGHLGTSRAVSGLGSHPSSSPFHPWLTLYTETHTPQVLKLK